MNEDVKKKMLDRVRKLLALSTSSNENEAAAAAEKAQAILAEYNISMSEVGNIHQDDDDDIIIDELSGMRAKSWRRPLATMVARMYFCKHFYVNYKILKKDNHSFVGTEANTTVAKLMFQYLSNTIDRLALEQSTRYSKQERGRFKRAFSISCTKRLCIRIEDRINAARRGDIVSDGKNLPVLASLYDQWNKKNDAYVENTIGKPRVNNAVMRPSHAAGIRAGREAADTIGLDQQMGTTKQKELSMKTGRETVIEQIKLEYLQSGLEYIDAIEALQKEAKLSSHEAEELVGSWEDTAA
jgi:hypothetical protein